MRKFLLSATILAFATTSTLAAKIDGSTLTATVASNLTQDQCAALVGPQDIPVAVIPVLPNACVNNMGLRFSNTQLAALTTDQVSSLSWDWLRTAGQAKQVVLLNNASSDAVFRILSLNMLTDNQISMVTPDQLNSLTANQFGLIPSAYFEAMTETQLNALRSDQISAAFDNWTDQQMRNLTPNQISGLPASQTSGLANYFRSWTNPQIQALTPGQLATIPTFFGYTWFKDVLTNLSPSQIASLSDEAVIQLASGNNLQNLSNDQLTKLQVSAVWKLKTLNLLDGLSKEQVAALPSTDLTLTAKFDKTCPIAGVTLNNLSASYSTQATQPAVNLPGAWNSVFYVSESGVFTVPRNATYVDFGRTELPNNRNFYGVNPTVFAVKDGGSYTVTCQTNSASSN